MDMVLISLTLIGIAMFFICIAATIAILIYLNLMLIFRFFFIKNNNIKYLNNKLLDCSIFYIKKLDIPSYVKIKIAIRYDTPLFNYLDGLNGWMDEDMENVYTINLVAGKSILTLIDTLAHEMIHVKQFCRGDLKKCGEKYYWKELPIEHYKENLSYANLPWEKEAFTGAPKLVDSILEESIIIANRLDMFFYKTIRV